MTAEIAGVMMFGLESFSNPEDVPETNKERISKKVLLSIDPSPVLMSGRGIGCALQRGEGGILRRVKLDLQPVLFQDFPLT